jgi:hypothetical protein
MYSPAPVCLHGVVEATLPTLQASGSWNFAYLTSFWQLELCLTYKLLAAGTLPNLQASGTWNFA